MPLRSIPVVAVAAASLLASSAHADIMMDAVGTGDRVALECSVKARPSSHFVCVGFILGVLSGLRASRDVCLPNYADVSDLLFVVQAWFEDADMSSLNTIDGATAVRQALIFAWPCRH
jgi:hypothetical protein